MVVGVAATRLGASTMQLAGTPGTYKERLRGCLASLNSGAGPAAAPRSPPRGNPNYAQVAVYTLQTVSLTPTCCLYFYPFLCNKTPVYSVMC